MIRRSRFSISSGFDSTSMRMRLAASSIRSIALDRKSTRLNSSHANISYAVFCLKKKHRRGLVVESDENNRPRDYLKTWNTPSAPAPVKVQRTREKHPTPRHASLRTHDCTRYCKS